MSRLTDAPRYARDLCEVLIFDRIRGSADRRNIASETAAVVRQARFHSNAKIPHLTLSEVVSLLSASAVPSLTLPGPTDFHGVGNVAYYHALATIVSALKPYSVLEFGTYFGIGTLTIALNAPRECRIVTLDLPDIPTAADVNGLDNMDLTLIEWSRAQVGSAYANRNASEQIEEVRIDSLAWQPDESLAPLDLAVIDGGHSARIVRSDTEKAFRLLADTGTVLWDDYFYLCPDVVNYLEGLFEAGRPLYAISGTNLVIFNQSFGHRSASPIMPNG